MLFSDKIKQLRKACGMRQKDVARIIGVDVPTYSRFEHGERRPRRETVVKLARLLKADADELVAMCLADEAYSHIAHDKACSRAAELLHNRLNHDDATAITIDDEASLAAEPLPGEGQPTVVRDLIKSIGSQFMPMFVKGDATQVMQRIEDESIDCIVTTPPYWRRHQHASEGITAATADEFLSELTQMAEQAWRVLKPQGSMWINIADGTTDVSLQALPWRLALTLVDQQGWHLINDVVWNKTTTSPQGSQDHLRKVHEYLFHLVKSPDLFYYNDEELRATYALMNRNEGQGNSNKRNAPTGSRYLKKISRSEALSPQEKLKAQRALNVALQRLSEGDITDLRLFLREYKGERLADDTPRGRAINEQGFYIQTYSAQGAIPGDVWDIDAEHSSIPHYTIAPDPLYRLPIVATCPRDGIVLDPYCGTGTACRIAYSLNRRSIGIDISETYLRQARSSIEAKPLSLF